MKNSQILKEQFKERGAILELYKEQDHDDLYTIFREVVDTGAQFPYEENTVEEFHRRFFGLESRVYVCKSLEGEVLGGFYLRTNCPGRAGHIANAAYMLKPSVRGKGLGRLLCEASLSIAKELGYKAMQYNMVLSENKLAVDLYFKLGFEIAGKLPEAVRNPDGSYQTGYILYRLLD